MGRVRSAIAAIVIATATAVVLVPLAGAAPAGAATAAPAVDPTNRASVLAGFQSQVVAGRSVPTGWTGDAASCTTGTESAASVAATRSAVNYYRALNGLPPVSMDASVNAKALSAALLMHANDRLSHTPPTSWRCYTSGRAATAGTSNLAQRAVGVTAIDMYMADPGADNTVAGHRRWVLDPRAARFGTGSTSSFNALHVIDEPSTRRPSGAWVAWPNAGFVPKRALRPFTWVGATSLFSLSSNQHPDADYSSAVVTVSVGGTRLAVTQHPVTAGYGDATLTWDVVMPADYDTSDADVRFDISVSGIRTAAGAALPTRSYSSTAIAEAVAAPGAPGAVTATAGKAQATVSWTAPASNGGSAITGYRVTPIVGGRPLPSTTFTGAGTTRTVTGLAVGTPHSFRVEALNAKGAGAPSAPSAAVTPWATAPPYAPYASWTDLVDRVFQQMVGRPPTASESSRWLGPLGAGTTSPGDLVATLRRSSHHTSVVDPVTRLYQAYFLRTPDKAGLEYWIDQRLGGRSMASISGYFARSSELIGRYGHLSDRALVAQVYENVLGRPGEAAGVAYWTNEITRGRRSRGAVLLGFSESPEYRAVRSSPTTVAVLSILWLGRTPTAAQIADGVAALDGGRSVAAYADDLLAASVGS